MINFSPELFSGVYHYSIRLLHNINEFTVTVLLWLSKGVNVLSSQMLTEAVRLWWEVSTDLVFLTGDYKELIFHTINIVSVKT